MSADDPDQLQTYRDKRAANRTPEPFGSGARPGAASKGGIFVVQKHAARRMHYDFRIEVDGVLLSWAVPHGPPMSPADKRLAVRVENHPLEYATFEGIIPEGNYGAGAVIVWDRGVWIPEVDPAEGLKAGEIKFSLRGYKLRGRFTLVNTRRPRARSQQNEWLLIKKGDAFATDEPPPEQSVLSGLTVEELRDGAERSAALCARIDELGAPRKDVDARKLELMLCQPRDDAFTDPGWVYELKYDGYRLLAAARDGQARLRYRSGLDCTERFPDIAVAVAALPYESLIIDGEVVVFDEAGRPVFGLLQQRTQLSRKSDILRAAAALPVTMVCFDLLELCGRDLRDLPLVERKALLRQVLPAAGPLRYCDHIEAAGEAFYDKVSELGLEGIIAKRAQSVYRGRRSEDWLKIRADRVGDFAVVGYTPPGGSRVGFGSLNLALRDGDRWVYCGRVGSGFSQDQLGEIQAALDALPAMAPLPGAPSGKQVWVEPHLVATIRYTELTGGGHVRQARFLHLRDDKPVGDCTVDAEGHVGHVDEPTSAPAIVDEPEKRQLELTNLKKVFWPEHGYTKGDLIDYYRRIGPWIMPFLEDRPVVLTRYPDGIHGKSFFQKDAPSWVPPWIRTEVMWSQHAEREIHYFLCDDVDSLVYLANLGTIPLHVWSSRVHSLSQPDWTILDLDPKGAPFEHVVKCARAIKRLCDDLELPAYCKTSGSSGLHVLIPLGQQLTYEQSRQLALLLARVIERQLPDISTTVRAIDERGGKVYLDWGQNGHGRLLVGPYSVRPIPGAPVSMPLRWSEVNRKLDVSAHTIVNAVERMERLGRDPLLPVLRKRPDLARALELLSQRVQPDNPA